MTAEVEQGHLADLLACADGRDKAGGETGLGGRLVPGSGATDEYAPETGPGGRIPSRSYLMIISLHDGF
jgi:hypothetical protein